MPFKAGRFFVLLVFVLATAVAGVSQETKDTSEISYVPTPAPGTYSENIAVEIRSSSGSAKSDRNGFSTQKLISGVEYRFAESAEDSFIPYTNRLYLSALPGERRTFTLELRSFSGDSGTFTYVIDRQPPDPPVVEASYEDGNLQLALRSSDSQDYASTSYYTSIGEDKGGEEKDSFTATENRSSTITIPWPAHRYKVRVVAFSRDAAGNKSPEVVKTLVRSDYYGSCNSELELLSPAEGSFANYQNLVIAPKNCFEWIRYSLDGSDPADGGVDYDEPRFLRVRGSHTLRVAAKRRAGGKIERIERTFTVAKSEDDISPALPEQIGSMRVELEPPRAEGYRFFYTLEEREVSGNDRVFEDTIEMDFSAPVVHCRPLRIAALNIETGAMKQYRYFYYYDNSIPGPPVVLSESRLPFRERAEITMLSEKGTKIFYTTDGRTPDRFSRKYRGPFTVTPPGGAAAGSVTIRAVARSVNERTSAVSSKVVLYDNDRPEKPEILIDETDEQSLSLRVKAPEETKILRYRLQYGNNSTEVPEVHRSSPVGNKIMNISFPHGFNGRAAIRVAAEDAAGNLSLSSEPVSFSCDTVPPQAPDFDIEEGEDDGQKGPVVSLGTGNQKAYTAVEFAERRELLRTGGDGAPRYSYAYESFDYSPYTGPIDFGKLLSEKNSEHGYFITRAYTEDTGGNRSRIHVSKVIEVDTRSAEAVIFSGAAEGMAYTEDRKLIIASPQAGAEVYYEIVSSEEDDRVPVPDRSSPAYSQAIPFTCEKGEEIDYTVVARSYLPTADSWSNVRSLNFQIDKRPPDEPRFEVPEGGAVYRVSQVVKPASVGKEERVWILLTRDEVHTARSAAEIRESGTPLMSPVTVEAEEGSATRYRLYAAVFDKAGNSSVMKRSIAFSIDDRTLSVPPLTGFPDAGAAEDSVTLRVDKKTYEAEVPAMVYELNRGYGRIRIPDANSPPLELPFSVEAEEEGRSLYTLTYRSLDEEGKLSNETGKISFLLKKSSSKEDKATEEKSPSSAGPEQIRKFISGIEDGKRYRQNIEVSLSPGANRDLRYSLRAAVPRSDSGKAFGTTMPEVDALSPRFEKNLSLTASDGATVEYTLSVGKVDDESGNTIRKVNYTVVIDKTPPLPPLLEGVGESSYYTEPISISPRHPESASSQRGIIHVRVKKNEEILRDFSPAGGGIELDTAAGEIDTYTVDAYSIDAAGNRSKQIQKRFTIDRAGIYVSSDGKDSFPGSREKPFRSIDRALYEARTTARKTLYLSAGTYGIVDPVELDASQIIMKGGFSPDTWKSKEGQTLISAADDYQSGRHLFNVNNGNLQLEDLTITNSGVGDSLIRLSGRKSSLYLLDTRLVHTGGPSSALVDLHDGELKMDNSRIEAGPVKKGHVLKIKGGTARIHGSDLIGDTGSGELRFILIEDGSAELDDCTVHPGSGKNVTALYAEDSRIRVYASDVSAGSGSIRAMALHVLGGSVNIEESRIDSDDSTRLGIGISAEATDLGLRNSTMSMKGQTGIVSLSARGGKLRLRDSILINGRAGEYSYILRGNMTEYTLHNTYLRAEYSPELAGIELKASDAAVSSSTLLFSTKGSTGSADSSGSSYSTSGSLNSASDSSSSRHSGVSRLRGISIEKGSVFAMDTSILACFSEGVDETGGSGGETVAVHEVSSRDRNNIVLKNSIFSGLDVILRLSNGTERSTVEELQKVRQPYDRRNPHTGNTEKSVKEIFGTQHLPKVDEEPIEAKDTEKVHGYRR